MGDHFVLLVDRLLTESTLEAAIGSKSWSSQSTISESQDNMMSSHKIDVNMRSSFKLVECRICHDEDEDSNMEAPCSCCGSLKVSYNTICVIASLYGYNLYRLKKTITWVSPIYLNYASNASCVLHLHFGMKREVPTLGYYALDAHNYVDFHLC